MLAIEQQSYIFTQNLRDSNATHLLNGVKDILCIQALFVCAADVRTTMIYTHVTNRKISNIMNPLDQLINRDHFNNIEKSGS